MRSHIKTIFGLILLSVCVLPGSAVFGQKLYPVQGPAASEPTPPIYRGHIRRPMFSGGSLFLLLNYWTVANGETLNGKCTAVNASTPDIKTLGTPDSYPPQPNLAFAWDAVKGAGYYVSHVLGNKIAQGTFTGSQGTVLQVESVDNQTGVAIDNKGNLYKIVW